MIYSNYKEWFLSYVEKFGNIPEIILKRDHSLRVENNMKNLFEGLRMSKEFIELADFIGLFHDIGRFEQWRSYGTYSDHKSIDHANYSAKILISNKIISKFICDRSYDYLIYNSIKYHNKFELPTCLSIMDEQIFNNNLCYDKAMFLDENSKICNKIISLYAMAIRDIDKIDILYQQAYFQPISYNFLPAASNSVLSSFFANKSIDIKKVNNSTDALILRLSFINDINLTKSLIIMKEYNLIDDLEKKYTYNSLVKEYFDYIKYRVDNLLSMNNNNQYILKK